MIPAYQMTLLTWTVTALAAGGNMEQGVALFWILLDFWVVYM